MAVDEISKEINEPLRLVKNTIEKLVKSGDIEKHKNRPLRFGKVIKTILTKFISVKFAVCKFN